MTGVYGQLVANLTTDNLSSISRCSIRLLLLGDMAAVRAGVGVRVCTREQIIDADLHEPGDPEGHACGDGAATTDDTKAVLANSEGLPEWAPTLEADAEEAESGADTSLLFLRQVGGLRLRLGRRHGVLFVQNFGSIPSSYIA